MERFVAVVLTNETAKVIKSQYIHDDIAFSILSKLPIKSFKRFECVCKSWSLLFDNPNFVSAYGKSFLTKDQSYYNDTSLLLHKTIHEPWDGYYWEETFELYSVSGERFGNRVKLDWPRPLPDYDSGFNILGSGSVNGILCLLCTFMMNIILWNPTTKEFKLIPPSPLKSGPHWQVWDDHKAFGYDRVKDDYKVLRHLGFSQKADCDPDVLPWEDISFDSTIWEVYSLRSNSWKKLDVDMDQEAMGYIQLYMDGLSHWMCKRWETNDEAYLLSFDWGNEVFLTTPTPSYMDGIFDNVCNCLVLLNGYVALILNYKETDTLHISILGKFDVKESWTKIFTVGPLPCLEYLIGAGKKGEMLVAKKKDGEHVHGEHAWFDLNTQMIEDLGVNTYDFALVNHIVIFKTHLQFPFRGVGRY